MPLPEDSHHLMQSLVPQDTLQRNLFKSESILIDSKCMESLGGHPERLCMSKYKIANT